MKLTTCLAMAALTLAPCQSAISSDQANIHQNNGSFTNDMIALDISGNADTRFTGSATLYADGETQHHQLDGSVPAHLTFQGEGIDLELTQLNAGNLVIELSKNGNRSSSRVSGQGSRVRLSVR